MEKKDIADLKLSSSKVWADGSKYFNLFDKHLPRLAPGKKVLVYAISNLDTLSKIMDRMAGAEFWIYDESRVSNALKALGYAFTCIPDDDTHLYNIPDMKFDCIIMNPPYSKNLHLKILAEAIKHLKDDESKVVNLSPILWVEDPHAHLKTKSNFFKFQKSILSNSKDINVIDAKTCNELFGIGLFAKLGIYECQQNLKSHFDYMNFWKHNYSVFEIKLFEEIYKCKHLDSVLDDNKRDGIRVLIAFIAGNRGTLPIYKDLDYVIDGMKDGKDWTKCNNGGYEKEEGISIPYSIKFNTENEAANFYNSCKTTFYKFISRRYLFDQNIPLYFLPWMEDYSRPWTDERFKEFFKLTDEEWKYIEDTMKKYEAK